MRSLSRPLSLRRDAVQFAEGLGAGSRSVLPDAAPAPGHRQQHQHGSGQQTSRTSVSGAFHTLKKPGSSPNTAALFSTYRRASAKTSPSRFLGRSPSRCDLSAAPLRPSCPTGDPHMFPSAFWETAVCFQCLAHSPPAWSNLGGHKTWSEFTVQSYTGNLNIQVV